MKRIEDKIKEIEIFLSELSNILPSSFDEYKPNIEKKAACERYVEKIVEAVIDLAFLAIKIKKFKIPQDDIDAFNILLGNKIINNDLATRLKNAKGMRNILVHQYGKIDDEVIFNSITYELEKDVNAFIKEIERLVKRVKE